MSEESNMCKGVYIPESLIQDAGVSLSLALAAFHIGYSQLSYTQQMKAITLELLKQKKIDHEKIVRILSNKKPQELNIDLSRIERCEWCKCSTVVTHAHHYPISRSRGGKKTVRVCPNCHYEFHRLIYLPIYYLVDPYSTEINEYFGGTK